MHDSIILIVVAVSQAYTLLKHTRRPHQAYVGAACLVQGTSYSLTLSSHISSPTIYRISFVRKHPNSPRPNVNTLWVREIGLQIQVAN